MHACTPATPLPERPVFLGPVEHLFWRLEANSVGAFRVALVILLDGCIESDLLTAALYRLQCRHPKLRAAIVDGPHGRLRYEFGPASPIPFDISDHEDGEFPWRQTAHRLMHVSFPASGPLMAVSVLRSRSRRCSQLLLTAHHALADGVSAIMLAEDLLTEYARGEADPDAVPRPALPPLTAMRAKASGGLFGRLWLLRRMRRMIRDDRSGRQTSLPEAQGIPPQSQWVHWVFSREDTLELVRRCRREQVSLGAALVAAVFCGLIDCLAVPEALLKCTFPFDIRGTLGMPVTSQDLGCFVSIMNEFYAVRQQPSFWDLARRAHHNHQKFTTRGGPSFYYNLAAWVFLYDRLRAALSLIRRTAARPEPPREKRVTVLATHYGVLNLRQSYGSLRPAACTLTFKNDNYGPSTIVEALVLHQQLNIGLVADNLDPAFWAQLQVAIRTRLAAAVSAEPAVSSPQPRHIPVQDNSAPQRMNVAPQE